MIHSKTLLKDLRTESPLNQKDVALDREVRRLYASNDSLFRPIKANKTGVVFESGLMRSFIGM